MITTPSKVTFPKLLTLIVYSTVSPKLAPPGGTSLVIATVLTASILGSSGIMISVGSSSVFPSVSSPSSLVSSTLVSAGLSPSANTLLLKPPASIASCSIT